ncbi:uncharacterized protein [Cicer arietinum]|uniref:uncharacterized protein n=1 Tax=Cicer arietinum TaxID=3827 RepID=UPI003CC681BC
MPMSSIGTSGGAIPLYPEVPVEPYTLDEIMDPGCVDCYNRIVIIPEGDGYLPFKSSAKAIAEVIQEKYKKPWLSWGEIKEDKTPQIREVDQFLHCFKTKCTWKREHDAAVLPLFDHRFPKRLSSMLAYARNKARKNGLIRLMKMFGLLCGGNGTQMLTNRREKKQRLIENLRGVPVLIREVPCLLEKLNIIWKSNLEGRSLRLRYIAIFMLILKYMSILMNYQKIFRNNFNKS